ncbi:MAG: D-sedoheptulose 7-phosphate isomerase, partial [Calditrichia bacterium]|nr:D-sedoheptulose 7-phosphate isomerase [Calditrichia bacterium]
IAENMVEDILKAAEILCARLKAGNKILICGNGGSAADAQHIAAELVVRLKSTFDRPAIPAIALTVNTSVLTAGANDYGFETIFSRQIEALANPGDVLIAISTSGNSKNIIMAVEQAKLKGIASIGFLGTEGGKMKDLVDYSLIVPSDNTAYIQESHISIGHILCDIIEQELFGEE